MTDPRHTDPRYSDPRSDTGLPQGESIGGPLGWIAGIAVIVLIVFVVIAGINHGTNTASNNSLATTGITPNGGIKPPSTTGSGGTSPQPMSPPTRSGQPLPPLPE